MQENAAVGQDIPLALFAAGKQHRPMLAACPTQYVATGQRRKRIVS
jgi:hypothetical protein